MIMTQLLPMAKDMGVPIPPAILDYSPLPQGLIEDWKKEIETAKQNPPPNPMEVQHKFNMEEIQAKGQVEVQVKQAEIQLEGQKAQQSGSEAHVKAQVDLQIADIEAQKDVQVAQYKADKEAETALMVAKIKADAEERVKMQQAAFQAQQAERQDQMAVYQAQKQDEKAQNEKENAGKPQKLEIDGLPELIGALSKPKTRKAKKGPDGTITMTEE